jgi:flagella basal body P-ring formation protein FlgA
MFALLSMLLVTATSVAAEGELGSTVVEAIRNHVAAKKGIPAEDVEVGAVGIDVVSDCEQTPSVRVDTVPGESFRGTTRFRIELSRAGQLCGRFSVSPRIDLYGMVPAAARPYEMGDVVEMVERRVAMSSLRAPTVDIQKGPFVATRSIAKDEPLTFRRVKRRPSAVMGQGVEIVASIGGITVKAEGRMLADAHLGDWVRVANLATDTVVQGTLTSPGIVLAGGRR